MTCFIKWQKFAEEQNEETLLDTIEFGTELANKGDPDAQHLLGNKLVRHRVGILFFIYFYLLNICIFF